VNKPTTYTVLADEDKAGLRLDRFLTDALEDMSRVRVKALIDGGHVRGNDLTLSNPSAKVLAGMSYQVDVPPAAAAEPEAQDIPLSVAFEDEHLIVINKSCGMVVHPAAGNPDGTLVNALLAHCGSSLSGIGGVSRPGIVHRLDKDTSGLMVVAKTDQAHRFLSEQFAAHTLERAYMAVVWGVPKPRQGKIEGNIGRNPANRKKMAVVRSGGKTALTNYKVERVLGSAASLVECRLQTGRTHQIRVHMANIGHAVVGDPLYGGGNHKRLRLVDSDIRDQIRAFDHQALHAFTLGFIHPVTKKHVQFQWDMESEIIELISKLEQV